MITTTKPRVIFGKIMRTAFYQVFILAWCSSLVLAFDGKGQEVLNRPISVTIENQQVEQAIKKIGKLASVRFIYSPQLIRSDRKVNLSVQSQPLADVLNTLLTPLHVTYEVVGSQIILRNADNNGQRTLPVPTKEVQIAPTDQTVIGTVSDEKDAPLPGVTIAVKGTTRGTTTDANGKYSLTVPEKAILVFSFVGYERQEVVLGNQTALNIQLKAESRGLDEVVVVGYGTQKRATLTGSVATIDAKVFQDRGVVDNPLSALQGQIPGVVVTRTSSAPGRANWNFQVRGASSSNGAEPLIIVDGVPLVNQSALNSINPNDIENISVLKDASAAIYGARAAGGVVLVTTKRAKSGKVQIQYDGSVSQKTLGLQPHLINVNQFGQGLLDATTNDFYGVPPTSFLWYRLGQLEVNPPASGFIDFTTNNGQPISPASHPLNPGFGDVKDLTFFNTNWVDVLWGKATSTQHNLSVSGRGEKSGYRVSLGYLRDGSLLQWGQNSNSRYNIRLTHDYQFTSRLKLESNISLEKNDIVQPTQLGNVLGQYQQPGFPISTVDGKPYAWGTQYSPNWQAELGGENKEYNTRVFTNFKLTYELGKNLRLVGTAGYNWTSTDIKEQAKSIPWYNYLGTIQAASNPTQPNTYYSRRLIKDAYTNLNAYLEYFKTFNSTHDVGVTVGTNYERDEANAYTARTNYVANDNVPSLNLGIGDNTTKSVTESQNHYAIGSYFGRFNYAFKQKYLVEVNARYDGSSKFSAANRWKAFYGISGGWRISQEDFMNGLTWLDELKLRGSYGTVGNQNGIGLYDYIQLLNVSATAGPNNSGFPIIGTAPVVYVAPTASLVSLNRTWEKIETTNFGVDYSVLQRRLSGSFDYFVKHNRNMLLGQTYPAVIGATAPAANIGHLKAWGWETSIQWRDKIGNVNYRIGGSLTDNQNKLISYGGANVLNPGLNGPVEGYPLNSYFGLEYAGRIQTAEQLAAYRPLATGNNISMPVTTATLPGVRLGDNMFRDLNGDGKLTTPGDLKYLGRDDPRYSFALNLGADWNGFDFSAVFQGVGQRTIFREGNWRVPFGSIFQGQTDFWVGKTWTPTNTDAYYPNLSAGQNGTTYNTYNYQTSDWSVQNGAYVRLKNLVVGYTLPQSLTQKVKIDRFRIYYSGSDLWEISKIKDGWDPEAPRAAGRIADPNRVTAVDRYPFYRLHTVGVNVTF
ncbi:TonB-dependent receptor [Spirosoma endbachense]|uniref:SusC/RagA family TonB-linked outer membrane protein n=1 Tax=Spirosoma endbachense TaxID=2666025 RepID=A0A6P1VM52_9BACT|nr:TonB-dependent receptor [Spirosoma endbachense]QHV93538.1 SusC/RagA family TonB-linked outer membrane protein [Spirosoma endbachense]